MLRRLHSGPRRRAAASCGARRCPRPARTRSLVEASFSGISRGTERLVHHGLRAGQPARPDARAVPGRRLHLPGQVRLQLGRRGGRGPAEAAGLRGCSACIRIRTAMWCRPTRWSRCPRGPGRARGAGREHGDGAERVVGRRAAVGDRIAVVGAGVVGALGAALAARRARQAGRADRRQSGQGERSRSALGVARFAAGRGDRRGGPRHPCQRQRARPGDRRSTLAGFEATVLELSWYGDQAVPAPLGEAFHSRRLTLRSSQVGAVRRRRRARRSRRERLGAGAGAADRCALRCAARAAGAVRSPAGGHAALMVGPTSHMSCARLARLR